MRLGVVAVRGLFAALLLCQTVPSRASDVPYVQTPMNVVDAMLQLGGVGSGDFLIDLGSGDGRIPIRAATRFGTRGTGVDIEDHLVRMARTDAQKQGVQDRVTFEVRDLFDTDLSRATVVTAYLYPAVNQRLRPRLFEQLRPGTRIVTHDFDFGDWRPDRKLTIEVPDKPYGAPHSDIMLWVVPADFSGTWQWTLPGAAGDIRHEAQISQRFQVPELVLMVQGQRVAVSGAVIRGSILSFVLQGPAGPQRYSGELSGNTLRGQAAGGNGSGAPWQAARLKTGKMDIGRGDATPFAVGN